MPSLLSGSPCGLDRWKQQAASSHLSFRQLLCVRPQSLGISGALLPARHVATVHENTVGFVLITPGCCPLLRLRHSPS
eukprot:9798954-Lingulodinium_polyedra.AAC.1